MQARFFRRLSHAPHLRALALLAWLAMACVPVVATAQALAVPVSGHAAAPHAQSDTSPASGCCQGGHCNGSGMSHCQACVASATGLILPTAVAAVPARFGHVHWPNASVDIVVRSTAPPLRPPRG